jgi:U3 small nucleolar RNA-associated protein 3
MGKKRKVSGRNEASASQGGFEAKSGKMRAYTTYEDLADSEDEFHINRDKVMLDDGPDAKRRKKWEEEGIFVKFNCADCTVC